MVATVPGKPLGVEEVVVPLAAAVIPLVAEGCGFSTETFSTGTFCSMEIFSWKM